MNRIKGVETNAFVFEAVINIIDSIIKVASQYNGKLYGDYLCGVIIPRLNGQICDYCRVSFLFPNQCDIDQMVEKMVKLYDFKLYVKDEVIESYELTINNLYLGYVQLSCKTSSVTLDTNGLYYYYDNSVPTFYDSVDNKHYLVGSSTLMNKIINKKSTILDNNAFQTYNRTTQDSMVGAFNKLIKQGWTLNYGDVVITSMTVESFLSLNPTILKQFKEKQLLYKQIELERDALFKECLVKYAKDIAKLIDTDNMNTVDFNKTVKEVFIDMLVNQID